MVRRDPQTGKFVSGGGSASDWSDVRAVSGAMNTTIPAADLAGGTTSQVVDGEQTEIVDWTGLLDNDEIFEVIAGGLVVSLSMPTTATAEGSSRLNWVLRGDLGQGAGEHPGHFGFSSEVEDGIADIRRQQYWDSDRMAAGHLVATAGFGDSVNGLGAGAANGFDRVDLPFDDIGAGPQFDADDEIGIPHTVYVDNVSDHAVEAGFDLHLFGIVHEV